MKIIRYILLILLVLIIGMSIYIATLNGNYDLKRSRIIKAPDEVIFNTINDYKSWQYWGPWLEIDSTIVSSYPEITSGVGASYSWVGKSGSGSMKTISLIPNEELIQQIDFGTGNKPEVYWNITKTEAGNEVTWGMRGKSSFGEKIYWLTQGGIEKSMTPMYDRGLELLEIHLLKEMDKHSFNIIGEVDYGGGFYLYQTTSSKINDINTKMKEMFVAVSSYMDINSIENSGKPFLLFHKWDEQNNTSIFSACIPIKERIITEGSILTGFLKPQKTFKTICKGNYNYLNDAWELTYKELKERSFLEAEGSEPFEIYTIGYNDNPNPATWITEIFVPIK